MLFSPQLLLTPRKAAGALVPTLSNTDYGLDGLSHSGTTLTKTGAAIGTASATRRVIVVAGGALVNGRVFASATIGGVAATLAVEQAGPTAGVYAAIFSAIVPTGTTGDIVITMSDTTFNDQSYAVYITDNSQLASATPVTGGAGTDSGTGLTPTIAIASGGIVVGVIGWQGGASKDPITITGYTLVPSSASSADLISFSVNPSSSAANVPETWTTAVAGASVVAHWK